MKNIEWLKEQVKKVKLIDEPHELNKIYYDEVLELIDQLDTPELPEIPFFVAEWIEKSKENKLELGEGFSGVFTALDLDTNPTKDLFWIKNNQELFARAWLDGYTVEEKKYTVFVGKATHTVGLFLSKSPYSGDITIGSNLDYYYSRPDEIFLTEQEIKDYDERYWPFAEEVME